MSIIVDKSEPMVHGADPSDSLRTLSEPLASVDNLPQTTENQTVNETFHGIRSTLAPCSETTANDTKGSLPSPTDSTTTSSTTFDKSTDDFVHELPSLPQNLEKAESVPNVEQPEFPDGGLRAWLVVVGATCITFATFGFVNTFGVFQAYYEYTLLPQHTPSSISWIGSIQYAFIMLPALISGRLLDLGYFKLPFAFCSAGFVTSMFLIAECKTYWQLVMCQGVAVGVFSGFLYGTLPGCVAHWFKKKRFAAIGIVASGSSIGGVVMPIVTRRLFDQVGFAWTLRILGFIVLIPMGVGNLLLRSRLPPVRVKGGLFNLAAFKTLSYTFFVLASILGWFGLYVLPTYLDVAAQMSGISSSITIYLLSIYNLGSFFGRVAAGILADKYGGMNILIPFTFIGAVAAFVWPVCTNMTALVIVALIYGLTSGAFIALLPSPAAQMGGIEDVGRRIGMLSTCCGIGAIGGPPIAGAIRTATGDFVGVGVYAGSIIVLGCVLMIISRRLALGAWVGKF